jgi:hypothetical protein
MTHLSILQNILILVFKLAVNL